MGRQETMLARHTGSRVYATFYTGGAGYLKGVLALARSLQRSGCSHQLVVFVTPNVGGHERSIIESEGSLIRQVEGVEAPEAVRRLNDARGFDHWNASFSKLRILSATEFEKIILLDSDMLIVRNIDCLFDRPHLSACVAGRRRIPPGAILTPVVSLLSRKRIFAIALCTPWICSMMRPWPVINELVIRTSFILLFRIGPVGTICTSLKNTTCFPTMQRDTRERAFWLAVPLRSSTSPSSLNHGIWAYVDGFPWRNESSGGEALPRFDISVPTARYSAMRPPSWISGP